MNIYIENPSYAYEMLFVNAGHKLCSLQEADLIVFTGGEDVSPGLYGKHPHPFTFFNERRDHVEEMVFSYAVQHNIPMVGICRG